MGALPQRAPSISDSLRGPGRCYAGQRRLRGTGWRPVRLGDLKPYFLSCLSFGCFPRSTGLQLHTPPADTVSTTSDQSMTLKDLLWAAGHRALSESVPMDLGKSDPVQRHFKEMCYSARRVVFNTTEYYFSASQSHKNNLISIHSPARVH